MSDKPTSETSLLNIEVRLQQGNKVWTEYYICNCEFGHTLLCYLSLTFWSFLALFVCHWEPIYFGFNWVGCQSLLAKYGQIFDAWRISVTRVSAPKSLKVVLNTNIFFSSKWNIFLKLIHVSLRYDQRQNLAYNACFGKFLLSFKRKIHGSSEKVNSIKFWRKCLKETAMMFNF